MDDRLLLSVKAGTDQAKSEPVPDPAHNVDADEPGRQGSAPVDQQRAGSPVLPHVLPQADPVDSDKKEPESLPRHSAEADLIQPEEESPTEEAPDATATTSCHTQPSTDSLPNTPDKQTRPDLEEGRQPPISIDDAEIGTAAVIPAAPRDISGRRNRPSDTEKPKGPRPDSAPSNPATSRPELICRESADSWKWELAIQPPAEWKVEAVRQGDMELPSTNGVYVVPSFANKVTIIHGGVSEGVHLFNGAPMVFKTRRNWEGEGRRVRGISTGHFVVIVPETWQRDGKAPVECAETSDGEFAAHFWAANDSGQDIGGFKEHAFSLGRDGFQLQGTKLFDAAKSDLFVGTVPELHTSHDVVWARVGEEGKPGGWSKNFKLSNESLAHVLDGRQGWFFIRVYDKDGMTDSGAFRYLKCLKAIEVDGLPYEADRPILPSGDGHTPSIIRFVAVDGYPLRPRLKNIAQSGVTIQPDGALLAAPAPESDTVSCVLESADIVVKLPRIWWRIHGSAQTDNAWHDKPVAMTRKEFRDRASRGEALLLKLPSAIQSVVAGFDEHVDQSYRRQGASLDVCLADFLDNPQIDERLTADALFRVLCQSDALTVLRIKAESPPVIDITKEAEAPVDDHAPVPAAHRDENRDLYLPAEPLAATPVARVRRVGGGTRPGKGFSREELRASELAQNIARRLSVPMDQRRHTCHCENVETLRRLIRG